MAFQYMQQSAIALNKNLTLQFKDKKSYIYDNHIDYLSNNAEFGYVNGIKGPPSLPEKLISNPISFINNQVTFFSSGKIQPGTAYLVDKYKNYQFALTTPISQISLIRKYKFENNHWKAIS